MLEPTSSTERVPLGQSVVSAEVVTMPNCEHLMRDARCSKVRCPDGSLHCYNCYLEAVFASRELPDYYWYRSQISPKSSALNQRVTLADIEAAMPQRPIKELRTRVEHAATAYREREGW